MSSLLVTRCSLFDAPALAANNIPAFWRNPDWALSWPHRTLEYHISQVALRLPLILLDRRDVRRHQQVIDRTSGRILGYARWTLPAGYEFDFVKGTPTWPEAQVPTGEPGLEGWYRVMARTARWDPVQNDAEIEERVAAVKELMRPKRPHMTLEYIAVHPNNQRKGVGTALLKSGMDMADELGMDIFLHAFEEGIPLYEKMGFWRMGEFIQDNSQYGGSGRVGAYFYLYEHGSRDTVEDDSLPDV